ncbi:hypothetical protein SLEP1_g10701 [Rubroshorea leprosula]|uniref:Uncharacterized protein n=1 Tax=Rubroshorea leprosula TaxID=152421 RepID=A0AAV5IEQ8_9ROSI|nr:hypothetical protein SLEP1_g10701 [Rubroshorea leprosula]
MGLNTGTITNAYQEFVNTGTSETLPMGLNIGNITDACQWKFVNTGTITDACQWELLNTGHDL